MSFVRVVMGCGALHFGRIRRGCPGGRRHRPRFRPGRHHPPTTRPAHKPDAWSILRDKSQAAFNSGDPGQIAGALDQLRSFGKPDDHRQRVIDLLMQAKRYDDAEQMRWT